MSYIVNQARVHSLTIGGVDYTNALVNWTASDASASRNGFITTNGSLILGSYSGGPDVEDYDRNDFRRGVPVILTMQKPDGSTYRHPRGLLYIISSSYDVQSERLNIEIGCRLAMAGIMDDNSTTLALAPIPLDPTQQQLGNISASFAAAGKYLYQDNQGDLVSGLFFDGDTTESTAPGEWTSILGVTALSADPLAASGAIPDSIKLKYSIPEGSLAGNETGRVDTETVQSYYYVDYPASLSVRTGTGSLTDAGGLGTGSQPLGNTSDPCGNTPDQPADNGNSNCQENYSVESRPWFLPAYRYEVNTSYYSGPAGQLSYQERETTGPLVEANNQYYADVHAYCVGRWASSCQPGGGCRAVGMTSGKLSRSTTRNYFGEANQLVKQVQEEYVNLISMADTKDWRSGLSSQGIPLNFRYLNTNLMVRSQITETLYYKEGNANVQKTTTYTSIGSSGSGISVGFYLLDARYGIKTVDIRRSTTTATLDVAPDIVNSTTTSTVDRESEIPIFTGRYITPPTESGPYVLEEQVPVPLLYTDPVDIQNAVSTYSNYLVNFVKGDAFGLQIAEGLREDIGENWYPGMPFRYYDPSKGKVLAMRMDATSWGVTSNESALVTNGIWLGTSNGTVTLPQNILGASSVSDGGSIDKLTTAPNASTTPPPSPVVPPVIDNETNVDNGSYAWVVTVNLSLSSSVQARNDMGVQPPRLLPQTVTHYQTMVAYCQGLIVATGGLLAATNTGGILYDYRGSLVTATATVVDPDLFV